MARRYTRDARGRFSSGGGGGSRGGGSKPIQRGTNRLTRDNAGRITSQGGNGATARGGRLATASGNKRQMQTAKLSGGGPKGTVGKPKGLKPSTIKPKAATSKPGTSLDAIARRRARAGAERSRIAGGEFNMKLSTRSAIVRSAANEIYNKQRTVAKASGGSIALEVARDGIGSLRGLAGSKRDRADQLQERARRRVVGGRRK